MDRLLLSRWFNPAFVAASALILLAVYSNSFTAAFQFDDLPIIVQNDMLRDLSRADTYIWRTRGLTLLTFALNYAAGGSIAGFHAANLAIHIVNTALVYCLLLYTFRLSGVEEAASRRLSALSALLFAVHPLQTQSVTYIVQRMESLSSLFYLLAIILLARSASASTALKRAALYAGVAASYLLAFSAKEIAYTLPAAALLYDLCFLGRWRLKPIARRWPLYAMLAALFAVFTVTTVMPLGGFGDLSDESSDARYAAPVVKDGFGHGKTEYDYTAGFKITEVSPREYLYTQFNVTVYYLALLAVPVNQNLDYDYPWARSLLSAPEARPGTVLNYPPPPPIVSLAVLLAVAGLGACLLAAARERPSAGGAAAYFIFLFFIVLSPTSSIVPIIDPIYEHRAYLASLGFFVPVVVALDWIASRIFGAARQS